MNINQRCKISDLLRPDLRHSDLESAGHIQDAAADVVSVWTCEEALSTWPTESEAIRNAKVADRYAQLDEEIKDRNP